MVYILTEPNYADSVWCKNFLNSLTENLRKNRIPFCEAFNVIPENAETVFIIASDYNWIKSTIKSLNSADIYPILICNHIEKIVGCEYSCVSSDIQASIKSILNQISSGDKKKVAIYGVNTDSAADIGKVDTLFSNKENFSESIKIFNNNGSLIECFNEFLPYAESIDAVICTNDFAAISLVKHLKSKTPEILSKLKIFSLTSSSLSKYYSEYIISMSIDYNQYGRAALRIYKNINKHNYISTMDITVAWNTSEASAYNRNPVCIPNVSVQDSFYKDLELTEMMKAEKILNTCDSVDITILKGLIVGYSIEQISINCYMTDGAIKYRIKKILNECNITDKNSLVSLYKKYVLNGDIL